MNLTDRKLKIHNKDMVYLDIKERVSSPVKLQLCVLLPAKYKCAHGSRDLCYNSTPASPFRSAASLYLTSPCTATGIMMPSILFFSSSYGVKYRNSGPAALCGDACEWGLFFSPNIAFINVFYKRIFVEVE